MLISPCKVSSRVSVMSREGSLASFSASLWCSHSVDSLKTAHASFHKALAPQSQGLQDVIRTVQRLNLPVIPASKIERGEIVGEGETFWVEHGNHEGTAVAIKQLKVADNQADPQEFLRRIDSLLLELQIMRHGPLKSHPNILDLVGYGWNTEGRAILPYIVVEYSGYGTLRGYLRGIRGIELLDKEMFIADIIAGIYALHTTGIVHGDIKLDNVLVFFSNERSKYPMAKICDFGHSIVEGMEEDARKIAIYRGTSRYNAPEVFNQKDKPILRVDLKKCDVWALGLAAWEILLQGRLYTDIWYNEFGTQVPLEDNAARSLNPDKALSSALQSAMIATQGTDDIVRGMFKHFFKRTLNVDPNLRISRLDSLALMRRWSQTGTVDLSAKLALHSGDSEWSYELFRFDLDREISWVHKEHIAQQFLRILVSDETEPTKRGSAAWQSALCYATGFGVSYSWNEADKYFLQAKQLGSGVATALQNLLYQRGIGHHGEEYTSALCDMLALENVSPRSARWLEGPPIPRENRTVALPSSTVEDRTSEIESAILHKNCLTILAINRKFNLYEMLPTEPPLIQGLRTRDWEVVRTLLNCGLRPETKDQSGRNLFHWLFMLDKDAPQFASYFHSQHGSMNSTSGLSRDPVGIDEAAYTTITPDPQWPTQFLGTPLTHAIIAGSLSTVVTLLDLGANPLFEINHAASKERWTAFHMAAKYHRSDILNELFRAIDGSKLLDKPFALPPIMALTYSSELERIAMHGSKARMHLEETISLLSNPEASTKHSKSMFSPLVPPIQRTDMEVITAALHINSTYASMRSTYQSTPKDPNTTQQEVFHYPVHLAAQVASSSENPDALKILELIAKHDPLALFRLDNHGRTPFHLAATGTSTRAVVFLMKAKPSLLIAKDTYGATPLHYCESAQVSQHLVTLGAKINARDHCGQSPLLYAAAKGLGSVVKSLCQLKACIDSDDRAEHHPLHVAIQHNRQDITTTLVAVGASINKRDNLGNTPLHIAARQSPRHILELLINNGADPFIVNDEGFAPLHVAVQSGNFNAVDVITLSNAGTILNTKAETKHFDEQTIPSIETSPFLICSQKSRAKTFNLMLARLPKADAEIKDQTGRNILHYAAEQGNLVLLTNLVSKKMNLDIPDGQGETALMRSIRGRPEGMNRPKICRLLVENGASATAQNHAGESAWDIAVEDIYDESQDDVRCILELLLRHSGEACRNITWKTGEIGLRVPCEWYLVHYAFTRPDKQLLEALEMRMPMQEFNLALEFEKSKKREQEDKIKSELERRINSLREQEKKLEEERKKLVRREQEKTLEEERRLELFMDRGHCGPQSTNLEDPFPD